MRIDFSRFLLGKECFRLFLTATIRYNLPIGTKASHDRIAALKIEIDTKAIV